MTKQELTKWVEQRIEVLQDIAYNIKATISKRRAATSRLVELESIYEKIKQLDDPQPQPQPPQEPCHWCKLMQGKGVEVYDFTINKKIHKLSTYCPECGRKLTEETK